MSITPGTVLVDWTGKLVGGRQILSLHSKQPGKKSVWCWECASCGRSGTPTTITNISRTKRPRCCKEHPAWSGFEGVTGKYVGQVRRNAKQRDIEFSINAEDMWNQWTLQKEKCAYSGVQLILNNTASLDRIDSSLGYAQSNIQWIHKDLNVMKMNMPSDTFVSWCKLVAQNS